MRGLEMGMLGEADKGEGAWEVSIYDNRFVKEDGIWKVREMRVFPIFRSDYSQGWGKSRIIEAAQQGALAPDKPLPAADAGAQDRLVPAFVSVHPVTGKAIKAAAGMKLVATKPLTAVISRAAVKRGGEVNTRIAEAGRKVMVAKAYDAAEHVSSSYGFFADDSQWYWLSELFGKEGTKQIPYAGYYKGYDRIARGLFLQYGDPVPLTTKKSGIAFHWRIQPVINIARMAARHGYAPICSIPTPARPMAARCSAPCIPTTTSSLPMASGGCGTCRWTNPTSKCRTGRPVGWREGAGATGRSCSGGASSCACSGSSAGAWCCTSGSQCTGCATTPAALRRAGTGSSVPA